jgi:hypothetical protein
MRWAIGLALVHLLVPATWAADVGPLMSWTDNAIDETGFEVERAVYGGSYGQIDTTGANVTSYRDTTPTPGQRYYWRIRAVNASGSSAYSSPTCARVLIPSETEIHP